MGPSLIIDSQRQPSDEAARLAQERRIEVGSMPLWRKRELAWGIVRGALFYRAAGFKRLPIIHRGVKVRASNGSVQIGHFSEIHDRVVLSAIGERGGRPARISIGDYTSIWYGTVVSARHDVSIGRQCAISWNCTIIDNDMHEIVDVGERGGGQRDHAVKIGDHVWIGAQAVVLKGVTIGENSVVAAGAIVTKDVPAYSLVAGAPAKVVRAIAGWH
ncbi:MAG TPA: acyltransferase [Blastocatellia bacterium]|jgi:acetyltransferase-like isoleucine patch superfamily enzyme|nr:acyltransferase [Blastocatellia bacterium]